MEEDSWSRGSLSCTLTRVTRTALLGACTTKLTRAVRATSRGNVAEHVTFVSQQLMSVL